MSANLLNPLQDIYRACEVLLRGAHGPLTERQVTRIREIIKACQDVRRRIDFYEISLAIPETRGPADPRVTLLYATRTPLTMVEMATRLLVVAHLRRQEMLTPEQFELAQAIADRAREIIFETERLWEVMKREEISRSYDAV